MRYGDLVRAWAVVESTVKVAMEQYKKSVEHIANLSRKEQ
jgi:hypothetical protein